MPFGTVESPAAKSGSSGSAENVTLKKPIVTEKESDGGSSSRQPTASSSGGGDVAAEKLLETFAPPAPPEAERVIPADASDAKVFTAASMVSGSFKGDQGMKAPSLKSKLSKHSVAKNAV